MLLLSLQPSHSQGLSRDPSRQPPNIVVILTDDQSWVGTSLEMIPGKSDSASGYYRTPNVERLAAMGTRFSQGYAPAASCAPTRRAILTGQSPARHIYHEDRENWTERYRSQLSIPRMLKKANPEYRTAHFGKWDLRFDDVTPEEMGYDFSDGNTGNNDGNGGKVKISRAFPSPDPKMIFGVTQRAIRFMETQSAAGNPFFVQISHYAVHLASFFREETLDAVMDWQRSERHWVPEFAAMTADLDTGIGILLDSIEVLGLKDNTYIFFLSDNGGRFKVPRKGKNQKNSNYPLRRGKQTLYEGGVRVPFIVAGPGIDENTVSDVPVTGLDILPTLADISGYPHSLPDSVDGGSLYPVLVNGGYGVVQRNEPFLVFHQAKTNVQSALILDNYKLVRTPGREEQPLELFDLSKDLGESNDLSQQMPEKTNELHTLLENYLQDVGAVSKKTHFK